MGNIECILATVNNLSDSDLKILANLLKLPTWSDPRKTLKIRPKSSFLL